MPTLTRRGLLPLASLLLPPPLSPLQRAASAAETTLTLDRLMALMAAAPERHAAFREQRRFAALEGVLESRGRLLYRRGYLEKITDWPQPERLEVDGERIVVTQGNDVPRVIEMQRAPELRILIDGIRGPLMGDAAALNRAFATTVSGRIEDWALLLVPRDAAARRVLREIRLSGRTDAIDAIIVVQGNGDEQAMTMTAR